MADHQHGMLDDVGDASPETAAPETPVVEAAPEAPETPVSETRPEAERKPTPADTRPDGYVTKGERDRVAAERDAERQRAAVAEDRFAKMVERFYKENEPEKAEEDFGPDPDVDPVGALKWQRDQTIARRQAEQQWQTRRQQEGQQEQQWNTTVAAVGQQFKTAVGNEPELADLYNGLRESIGKELSVYGLDPARLAQEVNQREAQIIAYAHANRLDIGQLIKGMAAARGIVPKAPQPGEQPAKPTPPQDPATGRFVSEADKAAKIAQSQERNASLGSVPGAPVKKMTPAELAKMPEEEMWRYFESVKGSKGSKQFDREMGFRT